MKLFIPSKAFIDPKSQEYEVGRFAKKKLQELKVAIVESKKVTIEGSSVLENYVQSKKTIFLT